MVPPLEYAAASFDAVFLSFTLELFPEEELAEVLREAWRVLRPGGRCGVVAMAVPDDPGHPSLLERGYVWMHRHFPHIVDCRPIDAASALDAAGLSVRAAEALEIWTMPVSATVADKPVE